MNNTKLLNLVFIQILRFLNALRYPLYAINSTNSYVRIYKLFMQNKANFRNDKMNITFDMTSNYKILSCQRGQKTNPIQTQFKPNQSQFWAKIKGAKPKQSQFKANSFRLKSTLNFYDCFYPAVFLPRFE